MQDSDRIPRRGFLSMLTAAAAYIPLSMKTNAQHPGSTPETMLLLVGTYTSGSSKSKGIYTLKFDRRQGALTAHGVVGGVEEPSFLVVDKNRKFLYAVNETLEYNGQKSGSVSSFAIGPESGTFKFLNKQPSMGAAPCHLTVSRNGRFLLVANYLGGNVAVLPVNKDGSLAPAVDVKQHVGSGPNKGRQEAAHAHSVILDANGRFAFVNDLGVDGIFIYEFDPMTGSLSPNRSQPYYQTKAGAGPRHFKFHPSGKHAFVINELDMTITSLAYDTAKGTLRGVQTVSTVPAGFSGENTCADIHLTPDGAFLYGSNRGHDSLVGFKVDRQTGRMELIGHTSTRGKTPRNFTIDPSGRYLLVANQRSDSIVVFEIEKQTGSLKPIGKEINVPSPVCLQLI
jgi:6-phosphogluconolactonase